MLVVSQISKTYPGAEAPILNRISFTLNASERCAIVGPNGAGKSTLVKIITGELQPDAGSVRFTPPDLRSGYLAQGLQYADDARVYDALFPQADALAQAEADLSRLGEAMAAGDDNATDAYSETLERLMSLGDAVDIPAGERALSHVGLPVEMETPISTLSGGQKTRLMLAAALVKSPELLILDEPTNHLDVDALEWLEEWLMRFNGGVLIVSHDRAFLDRIATHVLAIDPLDHSGRHIVGNYSDYIALTQAENEQQWAQWKDEQAEIARMKADVSRTMSRAVRKENATVNDFQRGRAKVLAQKAKAKETRLRKFIESDERAEKPERLWDVKIDFAELPRAYGDVVLIERASIGYEENAPLLTDVTLSVNGDERIVIMGANGTGKTTLIRTITGEIPPLGGSVRLGGGVKAGYLSQEQDILQPDATPLSTLQDAVRMTQTEARSFLHYFLFSGDEPLRRNRHLSYGERARLMLALLVARGCNLLIMDEPLNHLDLNSREQFEAALANYPGSLLMVAHDRHFVDRFASQVWRLQDGQVRVGHRQRLQDM